MTTLAGPQQEPILSSRAPYVPIVVLVGAALVIAVIVRALNTTPAAEYPLSGAPVGDGQAPVVVTKPASRAAAGSLSLLMPVQSAGEPLQVGPAAFPPGAAVVLSAVLPADEPTVIRIALSRLADDGTLQAAAAVPIDVVPDGKGVARVSTTVDSLTAELGAGIYQVRLLWDGEPIGGTDVALGLYQPSSVAIFDEARRVSIGAGRHVAVRMDAGGAVTEKKAYELGSASGAPVAAYAHFNGAPHVLVTQGVWAGFWLPLADGVVLE